MGPWTVSDQLAKLTHWNGGRNHLVLEIHDSEQLRYDIGTMTILGLTAEGVSDQ
jgi:hypothetical protein